MITRSEKTSIKEFIEGIELQLEYLDYFVEDQIQKRNKILATDDPVKYNNFTFRIDSTTMFRDGVLKEIKKLKTAWDLI
jgi:ABC-type microcin C transport system permease subunit YejE